MEKRNNGCYYDKKTSNHDYSTFECQNCSLTLCWSCSVKVLDELQGAGVFICPDCGWSEEYPFRD